MFWVRWIFLLVNGVVYVINRYVVKTLDNGESVKLQFGSLAKVSGDQPKSAAPTRANYPNWL